MLRNVNVSTLRRRVLIWRRNIYLHTNKCSFSILLKSTAKKRCKQQQLRYTFFKVFYTIGIPLNISDIYNSHGNILHKMGTVQDIKPSVQQSVRPYVQENHIMYKSQQKRRYGFAFHTVFFHCANALRVNIPLHEEHSLLSAWIKPQLQKLVHSLDLIQRLGSLYFRILTMLNFRIQSVSLMIYGQFKHSKNTLER